MEGSMKTHPIIIVKYPAQAQYIHCLSQYCQEYNYHVLFLLSQIFNQSYIFNSGFVLLSLHNPFYRKQYPFIFSYWVELETVLTQQNISYLFYLRNRKNHRNKERMDGMEDKISTNGRWTKLQHSKFLLGLQVYGRNWKKIQSIVGSRNGSQIRSHAQKYFLKAKKHPDDCSNLDDSVDFVEEPLTGSSSFFQRIIRLNNEQLLFNFWEELIDDKKCITSPTSYPKKSFILLKQKKSSLRSDIISE